MRRKWTKAELKRKSKNQPISTIPERQHPKPLWPDFPDGEDEIVVPRDEWQSLLEEMGNDFLDMLEWQHKVDRAIGAIEITLNSIFLAIAVGGRGEKLRQAIQEDDLRLAKAHDLLVSYRQHPPGDVQIAGALALYIQTLDDLVMKACPAIQACTVDGDGGVALRELTQEWGNERLQKLMETIHEELGNLGRPVDKTNEYITQQLISVMDELGLSLSQAWFKLRRRLEDKAARHSLSDFESGVLKTMRDKRPSNNTLRQRIKRFKDRKQERDKNNSVTKSLENGATLGIEGNA